MTAIDDRGDDVAVTFAGGGTETFEAVVVAEGVGSATREMVFPGENDPRWMDMLCAYFTIPRTDGDDRMWRWYNAPERRSVIIRPDNHGTARATLSIVQPPANEQNWSTEQQKTYLRERFAGAGWQTPRVLAGMDGTHDFYFDALRQVRMPRWSKGRVVLVGDAAWCVTPLDGVGATLAVVGAYERAMRPMVEQGQSVPKFVPKLANPRTRLGIAIAHRLLVVLTRPSLGKLAARLMSPARKEPDLSRYPRLETS